VHWQRPGAGVFFDAKCRTDHANEETEEQNCVGRHGAVEKFHFIQRRQLDVGVTGKSNNRSEEKKAQKNLQL